MKRSNAWLVLCAVHGVASMLLWWAREPAVHALIWRADTWTDHPWTLWSSAWVHLNTAHLVGNQLALGALAAFGWMVRPSRGATVAWLLCWPLIQAGLAWWPHIGYAVGLSGLLHAGAMVLAVQLLGQCIPIPKARRWGGLLALGLLVKIGLEGGWSQPVVWDPGNDMSVIQAAHLLGVVWGALFGAAVCAWTRHRAAPRA
ncbi:rhomboid family intramembrane serine protease [Hydrogenophaga sp.]|uniref:rhomboid family intramembrane serine protease n=1 Tax=Hydrogenophaga sp. TaxID=1904254 RepID=UPI00391C389B